jgi:hypothetical protein
MDVLLNEEEQKREKNMFAPHETSYELKGEGFVVALYEEKTSKTEIEEAPMTC